MQFTSKDYEQIYLEESPFAERLALILRTIYNPGSITDYGCANGLYLEPFYNAGCVVQGYEVSTDALEDAVVPVEYISIIDQSEILNPQKTDLALCIEVMEHIPEESAEFAISNLTKMSDTIIFTAAIPGQGGKGHINCQPKEYWVDMMAKFSFVPDMVMREIIVASALSGYHMGWFINNLIVFRKEQS